MVCEIAYEFVFLAAGNAVGLEREEPKSCLVPEFTFVHVQFPRQPRLMLGLDFTLSCGFSIYQATGTKSIEYDCKLTGNIPSALSLSPFEDYLCHLYTGDIWSLKILEPLQAASWPFTRASLSNYRPGIAPKRPTCVRFL